MNFLSIFLYLMKLGLTFILLYIETSPASTENGALFLLNKSEYFVNQLAINEWVHFQALNSIRRVWLSPFYIILALLEALNLGYLGFLDLFFFFFQGYGIPHRYEDSNKSECLKHTILEMKAVTLYIIYYFRR